MERQITTEELVAEALRKFRNTRQWYKENPELMKSTDCGRLLFMWEATYRTGETFRQYDDITFFRGLTDESFIPPIDRIISTKDLDNEKVQLFCLYPTAHTRRHFPYFQKEYRVAIRPEEKFIFQWEVDVVFPVGNTLRRTVIGIEFSDSKRVYFVISPNGVMTMTTSVDVSYEGE